MITLQELCQYTDDLLDVANINDYCKNGLQVEGKKEVKSLATAVSGSLEAIEQAAEAGVDALIVHHGMFWEGDEHAVTGVKKRKLKTLIENDISLLGYHLPLDGHPEYGNNWKAAKDWGWTELEPFAEHKGYAFGVKGKFEEVDIKEFVAKLEKYYQSIAQVALGGPQKVSSAGMVSGGGYKAINDAAKEGLDCLITGSHEEFVWHIAHEEGINFIALGHTATEKLGIKTLGEHLAQKFGVEHRFLDNSNPF